MASWEWYEWIEWGVLAYLAIGVLMAIFLLIRDHGEANHLGIGLRIFIAVTLWPLYFVRWR